jgi:hypothetical protein
MDACSVSKYRRNCWYMDVCLVSKRRRNCWYMDVRSVSKRRRYTSRTAYSNISKDRSCYVTRDASETNSVILNAETARFSETSRTNPAYYKV